MIPFLDLKPAYAELKPELDAAYARVMDSGWFVLGKEVEAFEQEYAAFCGTRYCVGLGNGHRGALVDDDVSRPDPAHAPRPDDAGDWYAVERVAEPQQKRRRHRRAAIPRRRGLPQGRTVTPPCT